MREYLKELRDCAKMTQKDVSQLLGISRAYYVRIETGERQKKISMEMARKLADVFGVSLEFIYEHEKETA